MSKPDLNTIDNEVVKDVLEKHSSLNSTDKQPQGQQNDNSIREQSESKRQKLAVIEESESDS